MSGRCKACDKKMSEIEMNRRVYSKDKTSYYYSELCTHCGGFDVMQEEEEDECDWEDTVPKVR